MKTKTLAALALIAALGASPAWAAEVVSSNIVGYTKVDVVRGLNLLAGAFVGVGNTEGKEDINSAIVSDDLGDSSIASFWDPTAKDYSTVTYYEEVFTDDTYEDSPGAGWGDADAIIVDKELQSGEGFWLQATTPATITLSGEVSTNAVELSLVNGMNLVGNPFPAPISISNITSEDLGDSSMASFWNSETKTYETVTYYEEVFTDDSYEDSPGAGWGDADAIIVDYTINAGEGLWIQATSEATVKISF